MRKPQANTLPVTETSLGKNDDQVMFIVLFDLTDNACFSLYDAPEPDKRGGLVMDVNDSSKRLHSHLLSSAYVGPDAQLAYLVQEFGGVDHVPRGRIVINVLGYQGTLPNGCITIDIPPRQVVAGYIRFIDEKTPKPRSARRDEDEDDSEDEEG